MKDGLIGAVFDYGLGEIPDHMFDGLRDGGPERLTVAGDLGLPQVICPGGLEHIGLLTEPNTIPERYRDYEVAFPQPDHSGDPAEGGRDGGGGAGGEQTPFAYNRQGLFHDAQARHQPLRGGGAPSSTTRSATRPSWRRSRPGCRITSELLERRPARRGSGVRKGGGRTSHLADRGLSLRGESLISSAMLLIVARYIDRRTPTPT